MFWGLLIIIGTIAVIILHIYGDRKSDSVGVLFGIFLMIIAFSGAIFMAQGIMGLTDYPYLAQTRAEVAALQKRLVDIKNADYDYDYKEEGKFVAGSIENYQQSTNLSKYIIELAEREAEYNGYLEKTKLYRKEFLLRFFGPGWAISDKVNNL